MDQPGLMVNPCPARSAAEVRVEKSTVLELAKVDLSFSMTDEEEVAKGSGAAEEEGRASMDMVGDIGDTLVSGYTKWVTVRV
jgi:hypothetical protein